MKPSKDRTTSDGSTCPTSERSNSRSMLTKTKGYHGRKGTKTPRYLSFNHPRRNATPPNWPLLKTPLGTTAIRTSSPLHSSSLLPIFLIFNSKMSLPKKAVCGFCSHPPSSRRLRYNRTVCDLKSYLSFSSLNDRVLL